MGAADELNSTLQSQASGAAQPEQESGFTRGLVSPETVAGGSRSLSIANTMANPSPGLNETPVQAFTRVLVGGAARDSANLVSHLLSPASLLLIAATGGLGAAAASGSAGAIGASTALGGAFALKGAADAATGQQKGESYADSVQRRLYGGSMVAGGLAGMRGSTAAGKARYPSIERIDSVQHDAAVATQLHIKGVSLAEHDAAAKMLNDLSAKIDAKGPSIDATKVTKDIEGAAGKLYGPGQAMPKPVTKQVELSAAEPVLGDKAGSVPTGSPAYTSIIQRLRDEGVLPDNSKWTFEEARQIKSEMQRRYNSAATSGPDRAAYAIAADRIGKAMGEAADKAGLSTEHLAANARYSNWASIFRDGPLSDTLDGANAHQIMKPLVGDNGVVTNRQLQSVRANTGFIKQTSDFYKLAEEAKAGNKGALARLAASPALFAIGSAIGRPFLGMFGLSGALIKTISEYKARLAVEPAFNKLNVPQGKGAVPAKPVPSAGAGGNIAAATASQGGESQ